MSENKRQFKTDIVIYEKSQGTVARHLRFMLHSLWQFTANSLLGLKMKEF